MKLNEPISEEDHVRADTKHRRVVEGQIELINEAIELIKAGEPLTGIQAGIATTVLQNAKKMPINPQRKRPAGHPAKIPDIARLLYAGLIVQRGMSETSALKFVAEKFQVSVEAVKRKVGKIGPENEKRLAAEETSKAFLISKGHQ